MFCTVVLASNSTVSPFSISSDAQRAISQFNVRRAPGAKERTLLCYRLTDKGVAMAVMLKHLYDLPMLTVALVEGAAFGGGAGLAAA